MIELLTSMMDWFDVNVMPVLLAIYLAASLIWLVALILQH